MSFSSLGLSPELTQAVMAQGYQTPTPIQMQAVPPILKGQDVMAAAQTGTGKTAAFTLPLLERLACGNPVKPNHIRALILTPTRELAAQVAESVEKYGKGLHLRSAVVFGGVKINPQMMKLRRGVDVLIATPGRLLDLHNQNAVKFGTLEILVLDEADRMLDMGFIQDIKRILALLPAKRQNLLFSATFSSEIRSLARGLMNQPVEISVSPKNETAATVTQWICPVDKKQKPALLLHLVETQKWEQVLVFTRTKKGADRLARFMESKGINAAAIHGDKSQGSRTKALAEFKNGTTKMLVATDIAARGLDINQLPLVVNFDLPSVAEDYVHRIGRTGRAGAGGQAVSLVSADEVEQLQDIERFSNKLLKRVTVDGFEPVHDVPATRLLNRPLTARKPKKPKVNHRDGQRSGEIATGHKVTGAPKRTPRSGQAITKGKNPGRPSTSRKPSSK